MLRPVLQRASPAFKRCYEAALERDLPELAGRARLTLTIAPTGKVTEVVVEFPMRAPLFTGCLREVALQLRFLQGQGAFRLIWPIVFKRD